MSATTIIPATQTDATSEIGIYRLTAHIVHDVVRRNLDGLTQADSLIQPRPAGNCLNWVIGHLLLVHNRAVSLVGEQPVTAFDALKRYERGSAPITNPAEAMDLSELLTAWDEAAVRLDAGIARVTVAALAAPAPFSPTSNPDETVGSLLTTILFHQSYHAGQTGILRRLVGKEGAIA